MNDAKKVGLPVEVYRAPPEEGHMSAGWGHLAPMNRAPHPKAAIIFVNWMLSKEGQLAWQTKSDRNSMRMDIPKDMITDQFTVPKAGGRYRVTSLPQYRDVSHLKKIVAKARADAAKAARKRR